MRSSSNRRRIAEGSATRKPIDKALLEIFDDGTSERI